MLSLLVSAVCSISLAQWVAIIVVLCSYVYWYLTKNYGKWEAK